MSSYCHSMPEPHPIIVPVIQEAGFGGLAKLRHLKVDHDLMTTLVERWRPETHTFHIPTGPSIIGPSMLDWDEMCDTLLGITPVKG